MLLQGHLFCLFKPKIDGSPWLVIVLIPTQELNPCPKDKTAP